jgi:hypothetical protein
LLYSSYLKKQKIKLVVALLIELEAASKAASKAATLIEVETASKSAALSLLEVALAKPAKPTKKKC